MDSSRIWLECQLGGIAVDKNNTIYYIDRNNVVIEIFNLEEKFRRTIKLNTGDRPSKIAVDRIGKMAAVISGSKITVLNMDNKEFFDFGSEGKNDGDFNKPSGIFINKEGRIFVSDTLNQRVQIFKLDGTYISTIGSKTDEINFKLPQGITENSVGELLVADSLNDCIKVFGHDGQICRKISFMPSFLPNELSIDYSDNIMVANIWRSCVFRYEQYGEKTGSFQTEKPDDYIEGIAVDSTYNVLISESTRNTIQIFGI